MDYRINQNDIITKKYIYRKVITVTFKTGARGAVYGGFYANIT